MSYAYALCLLLEVARDEGAPLRLRRATLTHNAQGVEHEAAGRGLPIEPGLAGPRPLLRLCVLCSSLTSC
jgi:hypothetical protein